MTEALRKVTCFLQNAWSPFYAGAVWPRESWLNALFHSRSGQRLRVLRDNTHFIWHFDNITPICGDSADSVVPADVGHVRAVLKSTKPWAVVACGGCAGELFHRHISLQHVPRLLILPHPAYRVVTNKLYLRAAVLLNIGFDGVIRLEQQRGQIKEYYREISAYFAVS